MAHSYKHGLTTCKHETSAQNLQVIGNIPSWLNGTLIRNGPAQFEVGDRPFRHWFDGHAMLHGFTLANGTVRYTNRFLQSPARVGDIANGKISYGGFATDPCRSIFQRMMSLFKPGAAGHNANINITKLADKYIAMTETPLPIQFDPHTLETVGVVEFDDEIDFVTSTAHPHYDPIRNVGVNHIIDYGRTSQYQFVFMPNEGNLKRQIVTRMETARPCYIHSFGMTENYLILAEFPYRVNPVMILLTGRPFIENFEWQPELGTKFHVFSKETGDLLQTWDADPFFAFHHINAYEDDGSIYVDICAYADHEIINNLYLDRLRTDGALPFVEARRYQLLPDSTTAAYTSLSAHNCELPRLNSRCIGKNYRYIYGTSVDPNRPDDFINALVKIDTRGDDMLWRETGMYPSEPVFVSAPNATHEDDGVVLSVVLDGKTALSYLLVLDASTFTEIGRADVPQVVPFGFHGQYFSGE